jgi:iron complex outermembrane receptor protein
MTVVGVARGWWFPLVVSALASMSARASELEAASEAPPDDPVIQVARPEPASEPPVPTPEVRSRGRVLEEIVVTAQKREENLQDVPISINAFSEDLLDAKGIVDAKDLPKAAPGLTLTSQAGYTVTYLRGVGSDGFFMADPSVTLYIDSIYFPYAHGLAQNFGAIERVEILKGPQGTLFGRNATGGAISIVSKVPSFSDPEVSVQSSFGSYDQWSNRAHVNVPLLDDLAFSVSALYDSEDSYLHGTRANEPLPKEISKGVRMRVRWAPTDAIDMTISGFRLQQTGLSTMLMANSDPSPLVRPLISPETGYNASSDQPVYFDLNNRVIYGQLNLHLGAVEAKFIGSDQYAITHSEYDFDGSTAPIASFEAKNQFADVRTGEFQILSNDETWGSDWLKWIGGVYYFESQQGFDPLYLSVAGFDPVNGSVAGLSIPEALRDTLSAVGAGLSLDGPLVLRALVDTESVAGFIQTTATLTDWFSLTLGARYQDESRTLVASSAGTKIAPNLIQCYGTDCPRANFDPKRTTKSFKPKVSAEFRPLDDTLVYLSYQQAIKSSAVNAINIYDPPDFVRPEEMDAYEVGVKTELFDGLVRLSAAVFRYEIKDLQVQFISLLQGGAVTFENAGGAQIDGVDFDTTIQLLPSLFDGLVLNAGAAYLDSEYTSFTNASGFDPTTRVLTQGNDYSGNPIARTPKFSGTLGLTQTFTIPGGSLEVGADAYHSARFTYIAEDEPFTREPAYTLIGARVSYLYEPWNLRLTAYGKNITDEKYNYGRLVLDFGTNDIKAPPATYGLRLNWDF